MPSTIAFDSNAAKKIRSTKKRDNVTVSCCLPGVISHTQIFILCQSSVNAAPAFNVRRCRDWGKETLRRGQLQNFPGMITRVNPHNFAMWHFFSWNCGHTVTGTTNAIACSRSGILHCNRLTVCKCVSEMNRRYHLPRSSSDIENEAKRIVQKTFHDHCDLDLEAEVKVKFTCVHVCASRNEPQRQEGSLLRDCKFIESCPKMSRSSPKVITWPWKWGQMTSAKIF
jgi:hypothetical protein